MRTATTPRRATVGAVVRPSSRLTTLNASDETAEQVLALAKGRAGWARPDDRDDVVQAVAVRALALVGTEDEDGRTWDVLGAVRSVAFRLGRDYLRALGTGWEDSADMTDGATVQALEAVTSYRPARPDGLATWTTADTVASALEAYLGAADDEDGTEWRRRLSVVDTLGAMAGTGRLPKVLEDHRTLHTLALALVATLEAQAHRDGTYRNHGTYRGRVGRYARRFVGASTGGPLVGAPTSIASKATLRLARDSAVTRKPNGLDRAPVARSTFPVGTYALATRPVVCQSSLPVVLTPKGRAWFLRTHDRYRITPLGARPGTVVLQSYRPATEEARDRDLQADHLAELSTPLAGVAKPNGAKRKRDGAVGSPTTTPRRRGTWEGRKS